MRSLRPSTFFESNKDTDPSDQLVNLFKLLTAEGIQFSDVFSMSVLKGLITLQREGYTSDTAMKDIFAREVSAHLKSKAIPTLIAFYQAERLANPIQPRLTAFKNAYKKLVSSSNAIQLSCPEIMAQTANTAK